MLDVLIVGGGPAGATLALALRESGFSYRILDARPRGGLGIGDRTLALAHNARLLFERIGIWSKLSSVTPIETIDISQRGAFGITQLTARELGLPALGYVIRYGELQAALDAALAGANIPIDYGCKVDGVIARDESVELSAGASDPKAGESPVGATRLTARLVVVADGNGESLPEIHRRKIDYRQCAVVGIVESTAMKAGVAYERFTPDGPVALLPYASRYALVWTATPARTQALLAHSDDDFLAALHRHFGDRAGRFTSVSGRGAFPLSLQFASRVVGNRSVVLGNAAQALHPIAGQGFNLGLRDVWTLAQCLLDTPRDEIGSAARLAAYEKSRRVDRWAGVAMTHTLVSAFGIAHPLAALPRGLGLTLLDSVPPLKRAFARAMLNGLR
ncbi:MAG: FAD-dependent monooxygenase [Casimicrobiaceae bacterium]